MFSPSLARRSGGAGRGDPVPFRLLWPVVLEELSRAHRARAGAREGDVRASAALAASSGDVTAAPARAHEAVAP